MMRGLGPRRPGSNPGNPITRLNVTSVKLEPKWFDCGGPRALLDCFGQAFLKRLVLNPGNPIKRCLMKFTISRYRYWYGYTLTIIIALLGSYFLDRAMDSFAWTLFGVAAILLLFFEYMVRSESLSVVQNGFVYRKVGVSVKLPVTAHIHVEQSFIQYLLKMGNVKIDNVTIHGVREPHRLVKK